MYGVCGPEELFWVNIKCECLISTEPSRAVERKLQRSKFGTAGRWSTKRFQLPAVLYNRLSGSHSGSGWALAVLSRTIDRTLKPSCCWSLCRSLCLVVNLNLLINWLKAVKTIPQSFSESSVTSANVVLSTSQTQFTVISLTDSSR